MHPKIRSHAIGRPIRLIGVDGTFAARELLGDIIDHRLGIVRQLLFQPLDFFYQLDIAFSFGIDQAVQLLNEIAAGMCLPDQGPQRRTTQMRTMADLCTARFQSGIKAKLLGIHSSKRHAIYFPAAFPDNTKFSSPTTARGTKLLLSAPRGEGHPSASQARNKVL
jgi:hypothetical protein